MRTFAILSVGLLIVLGVAVAASSSEETSAAAATDGGELVESRCTACHTLDRVWAKAYTAEEWADVVDRMIGYGAELDEAERAAVLDELVLEESD